MDSRSTPSARSRRSESSDSPTVINTMISEADQAIISHFAGMLNWRSVAVSALQRFGFSDAYLYVLRLENGSGQPHVAKIGPRAKIVQEHRAWKSVRGYLEMDDVIYAVSPDKSRAGLCFRLKSRTGRDADVVELDDYYRNALDGDEQSSGELIKYLSDVYLGMQGAHHPNSSDKTETYGKVFSRYLRTGARPDRLRMVFQGSSDPLEICGYVVPENPLKPLRSVLDRRCGEFFVAAIHGDLHLSNIVISRDRPQLVDYAWAGLDEHVAKDYVLMESSIRFMRFPRHVHPGVLLGIDSILNSEWDVEAARARVSAGLDSRTRSMLNCMLDTLAVVRKSFETTVEKFKAPRSDWESEYFLCLYLMLAGQQRFGTFPLNRTAVNLHQLRSWT